MSWLCWLHCDNNKLRPLTVAESPCSYMLHQAFQLERKVTQLTHTSTSKYTHTYIHTPLFITRPKMHLSCKLLPL